MKCFIDIKECKMGWGKVRARPATDAEKLILLHAEMIRDKELGDLQTAELVEALFVKYQENPDKYTKKLLIMHMGSEFFERT